MNFIKNNFYDIVRLIIIQVGITIFSFVIYTAAGAIELESGTLIIKICISVFSMLFYFSLLYTTAWDWGAKDKIRIDGGRMQKDDYKGIKMSLLANIPNFVLSFLCALALGLYILGVECLNTVAFIFNTLMRFWMGMYLGVLQGIFNGRTDNVGFFFQAIGYFVIPILSILVTHFGYKMGSLERKIFSSKKKKTT